MWIMKILRVIGITIDEAVYGLVNLVYQLFIKISETGIFSNADIRTLSERVYFFLGLLMLFKVSISIVQYIMNPDMVKDSKVGAGKIIKNVVFILLGIILIPYAFEIAFSFQRIILSRNVIGNLILGQNSITESSGNYVKDAGKMMAYSTFTAFFQFSDKYFEIDEACIDNPFDANNEWKMECQENEYVYNFMNSPAGAAYKDANAHKDVGYLWDDSVYNYTAKSPVSGDDEFLFKFSWPVELIAGGFLVYILIVFCIDVAVRSVKLGFLQLIAPIPLIAKIDPNKGDKVFSDWLKECTSTYISVFIRLAALYFVVYILTIIDNGMFNVISGERERNPFVFVFIILGSLLFAKDLPKLIEKITGIKLDGDGLSLSKKLKDAGGVVSKATPNFVKNGASRALGAYDNWKNNGKDRNAWRTGWKDAKKRDKGMLADIRKKKNELMPQTAKAKEQKNEGLLNLNAMSNKWKKGEAISNRLGEKGKTIKNLDGKDSEAYKLAYKGASSEFINSKMRVDAADARRDKMQDYMSALSNTTDPNEQAKIFAKMSKLSKEITGTDNDIKTLADASEFARKTTKMSEGAQKTHDELRKVDQAGAAMEDQIKYYKNNSSGDPTGGYTQGSVAYNAAKALSSGQLKEDVKGALEKVAVAAPVVAVSVAAPAVAAVGLAGAAVTGGVVNLVKDIKDGFQAGKNSGSDSGSSTSTSSSPAPSPASSPAPSPAPSPASSPAPSSSSSPAPSPAPSSSSSSDSSDDRPGHYYDDSSRGGNDESNADALASALNKLQTGMTEAVSSGIQNSSDHLAGRIGSEVGTQVRNALGEGVSIKDESMNRLSQKIGQQIGENVYSPNHYANNSSNQSNSDSGKNE